MIFILVFLQVRYSVLTIDRVNSALSDSDLSISTSEPVWKKIFSNKLTMAAAYNNGDIKIGGNVASVRRFLLLFDDTTSLLVSDSLDK